MLDLIAKMHQIKFNSGWGSTNL